MTEAVTFSNVQVRRRFCTILQIDRLTIPTGQFVGLIGPNGAGKTTLLKLCCGLIKPGKGQVGRHCRRIGYIPQQTDYNAHLPFTVREIVAMGRNDRKPPGRRLTRADYETVDFWLSRTGLYERRHQTFRSLSGGQQQKTLIARAMAGRPELLLMDEPGANLDQAWKRQLREILDSLYKEHRMSIVLISHEREVIPNACQRLILLNEGRIAADGTPETVLNTSIVRHLLDGLQSPARER